MDERRHPRRPGRLRDVDAGAPVSVGGRVTHSEGARVLLADGSGAVQVWTRGGDEPRPGDWAIAHGSWDGAAVREALLEVVSHPRRPFPAPHGEWLHLHGDGGARLARLEQRARILGAIRRFFDARGFLEVETPLAVPSPGLDLHLEAAPVDGLGAPRFWVTSPEYQMKRLLAGGLTRIYQLARCARLGERGPLHEPEFTMLEWYRGFAGSSEVMRDTEELVAALAQELHGQPRLMAWPRPIDVEPPWERSTVAEAFERHAGVALEEVLPDETRFFQLLVERVEPALGYPRPVFLTDWPASMASLARLRPDDPRWADRVEAYVDGIELSNGFGELIDPAEQRARLERDRDARRRGGLAEYPIDARFLAALEEGLPPSGGNALGVDRLVMLLLGAARVDEVMALPSSVL